MSWNILKVQKSCKDGTESARKLFFSFLKSFLFVHYLFIFFWYTLHAASHKVSIVPNHDILVKTKKLRLVHYPPWNSRLYSDFPSFPSSGVTGINSSTAHCICLLVFLKATCELLNCILNFFWAHKYHVFIWKALGYDQNAQKSEYWHTILLTGYGHSIWLPLLHLTLFSKN